MLTDHELQTIKADLEQRTDIRAARLVAEIERMKGQTYCAYCGFTVDMDADAALVSNHIHTCPRHPIADYRAQINGLKMEIENLKKLNLGLLNRVALQSELLSSKAEKDLET